MTTFQSKFNLRDHVRFVASKPQDEPFDFLAPDGIRRTVTHPVYEVDGIEFRSCWSSPVCHAHRIHYTGHVISITAGEDELELANDD